MPVIPARFKGKGGARCTTGRPLPSLHRKFGGHVYTLKSEYGCMSKGEAEHLKKYQAEAGFSVRLVRTSDGYYFLYRRKM